MFKCKVIGIYLQSNIGLKIAEAGFEPCDLRGYEPGELPGCSIPRQDLQATKYVVVSYISKCKLQSICLQTVWLKKLSCSLYRLDRFYLVDR